MELAEVRTIYTKVLENVSKVIIGKEELFSLIFTALLSGGHVLLEDNPGTGKTTLAKCIAKSIEGEFRRVQFTPDLMPQDITGLNIYDQKEGCFHLVKGPVFTNILLADEINRATPRTQSSLLEAMEERQVTIDGDTLFLEEPFLVIATENPIETSGTYPLPEAQLDRFMMKLSVGQLTAEEEVSVLKRFLTEQPLEDIQPVIKKEELCAAIQTVRTVFVHETVMNYIAMIAEATRTSSKIMAGVSPRASLALLRTAQSFAAISGREFVTPEDVKFLAPYVFSHRIITYQGTGRNHKETELIQELVKAIPVPVEEWSGEKK